MENRTLERVEGWPARSISGGFGGLQELADHSFSGAVRCGGATLFALNGRVIGVFGGTIDEFADGSATAYDAPDPALPLLLAMQETGGEVRGQYYTEETSIEEVDRTLSDANFTGYVELSENVLSGDYYVCYYGGRSLSVAFVGASENLLTDDEAYERAADEVGIYRVVDVDLEVTEVPEPPEPEPDEDSGAAGGAAAGGAAAGGAAAGGATADSADAAGGSAGTDAAADEPADATADPTDETRADAPTGDGPDAGRPSDADPVPDAEVEATSAEPEPSTAEADHTPAEPEPTAEPDHTPAESEPTAEPEPTAESATDTGTARAPETGSADTADANGAAAGTAAEASGADTGRAGRPDETGAAAGAPADSSPTSGQPDRDGPASAATDAAASEEVRTDEDVFSEEAEWRETRSIPALDPDETEAGVDADDGSADAEPGAATGAGATQVGESRQRATGERQAATTEADGTAAGANGGSDGATGATADLREAVRERERQLRALEERLAEVEAERESLATENDDLRAERDELASERDRLRAELEETRSELASVRDELATAKERLDAARSAGGAGGGGAAGGRGAAGAQLSPSEALSGTNLFVRYGSKGEPTLADAHDGPVEREAVDANLRLESHTRFEADDATVAGEPYESFLHDTLEHRFVTWVVRELLYEIRDSGHEGGLRDLFDAIPEIDRAQLHGTVTVEAEGDDGGTTERTFDVVLRDKMGRALVVADLHADRSPVTADAMGALVDDATAIAEANDHLAAAISVTESFFRPDGLETATGATGGGFLSRDKRESFVRVGRKQGYHLCLVEAREGSFHVSIPEL